MKFTIDLSLLTNPFLYVGLYVLGFFIAANYAAVRYRRRKKFGYDVWVDPVDYGIVAIFWPIYLLIVGIIIPLARLCFALLLLPSKLFK